MQKILLICIGNSCRSQIAHGYFTHFGKGQFDIKSGGIQTDGVNPRAIAAMKEDGIDIAQHSSNLVKEYLDLHFDYIITLCDSAKARCPTLPSATHILHEHFPTLSIPKASKMKFKIPFGQLEIR